MDEPKLTKKFIADQKEKLLKLKTKLMNDMKSTVKHEITDADKSMSDEGDLAQTLTSQNVALQVHDSTLKKLRNIELALHKMEMGTYGICEETGDPIEIKRLQRIPWARISIVAAEDMERDNRRFYGAS